MTGMNNKGFSSWKKRKAPARDGCFCEEGTDMKSIVILQYSQTKINSALVEAFYQMKGNRQQILSCNAKPYYEESPWSPRVPLILRSH